MDPDFEPKQLLFVDQAKHEAFRERMLKRVQEKPASEWMELCGKRTEEWSRPPIIRLPKALHDPDIKATGT